MPNDANTTMPDKITSDDIERKLRALQGEVRASVDDKKPALAAVAGGAGFALLLLFFFLGRRAGRKKSAVIEIRRI